MESDPKKSIADKLKLLGVIKKASDLPQPSFGSAQDEPDSHSIDSIVSGSFSPTQRGDVFIAKQTYPIDYVYGSTSLLSSFPLSLISQWAGDSQILNLPI